MYVQAGECHCHDSVLALASAAKDFREAALITERQGRYERTMPERAVPRWIGGGHLLGLDIDKRLQFRIE